MWYIYIIYIIIYNNIYICVNMLSWKQCALPVITTMALWQTHALGHMITGRVHFFVITYYTHLASVRFEHSVCCGSLMTTYMCVYISEHYVWKITMVPTFISLISFALFARSFEDGQNHLLPPVSSLGSRNLRLIQTQRKLKGGWSYQVFVLLCSKKGKHCKWLCLEHLWNDIAWLLRYVFQLINHKL